MIDVYHEKVFPLTEAPKHTPTRAGKRIHRATTFRWALHGLRGVRLETIKIGGHRYTSREALARFYAELSRSGSTQPPESLSTNHSGRPQADIHRRIQEITTATTPSESRARRAGRHSASAAPAVMRGGS